MPLSLIVYLLQRFVSSSYVKGWLFGFSLLATDFVIKTVNVTVILKSNCSPAGLPLFINIWLWSGAGLLMMKVFYIPADADADIKIALIFFDIDIKKCLVTKNNQSA